MGLWIPLTDFFYLEENFKIQEKLGEDRVMDSLIV